MKRIKKKHLTIAKICASVSCDVRNVGRGEKNSVVDASC
jgi:hypothetical protein